jgi:hypothetical protein
MAHGLVELEPDADGLGGAGGLLAERTVGELGPLLLGELLDVAASRELGVVGEVG